MKKIEQVKSLIHQAINENVRNSAARRIIRYVLECEIQEQSIISPSNKDLAQKYNWTLETAIVSMSLAKKSQFIIVKGKGGTRCLKLNVNFLKNKIVEIQKKNPIRKNLLEDLVKEFIN